MFAKTRFFYYLKKKKHFLNVSKRRIHHDGIWHQAPSWLRSAARVARKPFVRKCKKRGNIRIHFLVKFSRIKSLPVMYVDKGKRTESVGI